MRKLLIIAAFASVGVMPAAHAQSSVEGRVGKLESEMRAVQRKVFPGGAPGALVQPEISPEQIPAGPGPGSPASSPIADLSARVTALEQQLSGFTGQIEQNQFKLRQLEDAFNAYKRATDARLDASIGGSAGGAVGSGGVGGAAPAGTMGSSAGPVPSIGVAPPPVTSTRGGAASARPATDPARAQLAAAVQKPSTGDAPEDAYLYGYRLWQAKLYPEAEAQLKQVVTEYPKHRRASFAQNLLGRSYLDEGKPSLASMAFYDNYKKMPDGERAPDSLLYLGQALQKLDKPADACKVYGELSDVYGSKLSPEIKADIARNRVAAKCK